MGFIQDHFFFSIQIYRILGRTVATYPKLLDETDFYMALDMSLLIDEIKVLLRQSTTKTTTNDKRPSSEVIVRKR